MRMVRHHIHTPAKTGEAAILFAPVPEALAMPTRCESGTLTEDEVAAGRAPPLDRLDKRICQIPRTPLSSRPGGDQTRAQTASRRSGPPHQWRQARQPRRKPRSVAFPGRTCTHPQGSAPQETRCIIHLNPLTASPRLRRRRRGPKVRGNSASSAPRSWGQAKPLTSRGRSAAR